MAQCRYGKVSAEMQMIEVGLIGYGLAGRAFHAPVIRAVPGMHLAAILQRTGNQAAEEYPDIRIVRSLDELLGIREIRLTVIATPNDGAWKRGGTWWWISRLQQHLRKHDRSWNLRRRPDD